MSLILRGLGGTALVTQGLGDDTSTVQGPVIPYTFQWRSTIGQAGYVLKSNKDGA